MTEQRSHFDSTEVELDNLDSDVQIDDSFVNQKRIPFFKKVTIRKLLIALTIIVIIGIFMAISIVGLFERTENFNVVLLICVRGFGGEYLLDPKFDHLKLDSLREKGLGARLVPQYPSHYYPNMYTLVTGLYPEVHGVTSDSFYDSTLNETFWPTPSQLTEEKWFAAEPLWTRVERSGLKSGVINWPGSLVAAYRPSLVVNNASLSSKSRVKTLLSWLSSDVSTRPSFVACTFEEISTAYARPHALRINDAVKKVDEALHYLKQGISQLGRSYNVNIFVVSDHGRASVTAPIFLDAFVSNLSHFHIPDINTPNANLWPRPGTNVSSALRDLLVPNVTIRQKPHCSAPYFQSPRVAPTHLQADFGYVLAARDVHPNFTRASAAGWDPRQAKMSGVFIGNGKAFLKSSVIKTLNNVEIYNLIAATLKLQPLRNNGTFPYISGYILD